MAKTKEYRQPVPVGMMELLMRPNKKSKQRTTSCFDGYWKTDANIWPISGQSEYLTKLIWQVNFVKKQIGLIQRHAYNPRLDFAITSFNLLFGCFCRMQFDQLLKLEQVRY